MIEYRLKNEYGASVTYEPVNLAKACWVSSNNPQAMKEFLARRKRDIAKDTQGQYVFLAESTWALQTVKENHPEIQFHNTSEF